ncbi:WhiB family transcriptional regulator [Actinopolyspora halophila]|uniref:WhiB family transcriptional regulator n=1 Tax=Actinopolyspora halophila TaxID=1850 RepID=UPI0003A76010|nr:WhiB family transcriptional regulator [Actinopolyspora halophila]
MCPDNRMRLPSMTKAGSWRRHAACAGADPELFSVQHQKTLNRVGYDLRRHPVTRQALEYCDRCPVKQECLNDALTETGFAAVGIWGGIHISWRAANANLAHARAPRAQRRGGGPRG